MRSSWLIRGSSRSALVSRSFRTFSLGRDAGLDGRRLQGFQPKVESTSPRRCFHLRARVASMGFIHLQGSGSRNGRTRVHGASSRMRRVLGCFLPYLFRFSLHAVSPPDLGSLVESLRHGVRGHDASHETNGVRFGFFGFPPPDLRGLLGPHHLAAAGLPVNLLTRHGAGRGSILRGSSSFPWSPPYGAFEASVSWGLSALGYLGFGALPFPMMKWDAGGNSRGPPSRPLAWSALSLGYRGSWGLSLRGSLWGLDGAVAGAGLALSWPSVGSSTLQMLIQVFKERSEKRFPEGQP